MNQDLNQETKNEKATQTEATQTIHTIDLAKLEGTGDFPCPGCGVEISPADNTDEIYTIKDKKIEGENLKELLLECQKCGCKMRMIGFV